MAVVQNESKIPVGTILVGKYRVTREIGRGGMAAVYEAEHLALGKKIAVKVLAAELSASTIVIERFFREARAAASVKSPHIVDVYDSGRLEDGRPFIAMELLEGESLYDRMARIRLIEPKDTVRIITQCARGLMKAHAAGIVHRDLKPENIFLLKGEDGEEISKILDFGLAKFYSPVNPDEKSARLTREGAVFGTPAYMSPEQVKGQGSVDHRADLWALGCMAFECLIGRPVWNTEQGVAMTFAAIATAPIPVPSKIRHDLPLKFDQWFAKALERDPNNRFQTAKELADALADAFGGSSRLSFSQSNPDVQAAALAAMAEALPEDALRSDEPYRQSGRGFDGEQSHESVKLRVGSHTSGPQRVNGQQSSGMDVPPTLAQEGPVSTAKPSRARYVISALALAGGVTAAIFVWVRVLRPQVFTPTVLSTATVAPVGSTSGSADAPAGDPWLVPFYEGLKLYSANDAAGAQKKLKDAADQGGNAVAKGVSEQLKIAAAGTGPCKLVSIAHPRIGVSASASWPVVAATAKGALVAWIDDHEAKDKDHVYSVVVDPTGRPYSAPRDLTPESGAVGRATLVSAGGERTVLLYTDTKGRDAGIRARFLDADGRIGGRSVPVGAVGRTGQLWPAIDKVPGTGFWVAWQDDRHKEGDDLYVRQLTPDLEPLGTELRATDYAPPKPRGTVAVREPSVAVVAGQLYVAYRLDRDQQRFIMRMRMPLAGLTKGLDDKPAPNPRKDRELGDVKLVNEDKAPADYPDVRCGKEGCFISWHGDKGGAYAAMLDPADGKVVWRNKFADRGSRPALGLSDDGQVYVAFFEGGRVKVAPLSRDGVGTQSVFAKVSGERDRPSITGAREKGEWYVSWLDAEGNRAEPYVARLACK
jgi:serine/threonine-protein kinase